MDEVHMMHVLETQTQINEYFPYGFLAEMLVPAIHLLVHFQVLNNVSVQVAHLAVLNNDINKWFHIISTYKWV